MSKIKRKLIATLVRDITPEKEYVLRPDYEEDPCHLVEGDEALRMIFKHCGFDIDDKEKMDKLGGVEYLQKNSHILNLAEGYVEGPGKGRKRGLNIYEVFEYEEGKKQIEDIVPLTIGKRYWIDFKYGNKEWKFIESGVYAGCFIEDGRKEIRFKYAYNHEHDTTLTAGHGNIIVHDNSPLDYSFSECNLEYPIDLWDSYWENR